MTSSAVPAGTHGVLLRLQRLRDRWHEGSLTVLLAVQVLVVFGLVPAAAVGLPLPPGVAALVLLLFMSLTIAVARGRWAPVLGGAMLALASLTAVLQGWLHGWQVKVGGEVAGLATFLLLGGVVLRAVFGPGRFTSHRIRGAVVFYLNLGLSFAFVHRILAEVAPGSYDHLPRPEDAAAFRAALDYFSFTTLTSVGYGDILPVSPIARALCMLEAVLGQMLPTVLIARVVTRSLQEEDGGKPEGPGL